MTRHDHVTALTGYVILSVAILALGLYAWVFRVDGSFMDFVMAVIGALAVQIYGGGRHARALAELDDLK